MDIVFLICINIILTYLFFFIYIVITNEFGGVERVMVESFKVAPGTAKHIEVCLSGNGSKPDKEFLDHLMIHVANTIERQFIKPCDILYFSFYAREVTLEICNIHPYSDDDIENLMNNISLNNEQYFYISPSTTWSLKAENDNHNGFYPITNMGGLFDIYDKVMNIASKTKYQGEYQK